MSKNIPGEVPREKSSERAANLSSDAASLRELGMSQDEVNAFMLERVGLAHSVTTDTLPDQIVEDVKAVAKNTHPN